MNYATKIGDIIKGFYHEWGYLFIPTAGNDFKPRFLQSPILKYLVALVLVLKIASIAFYVPISQNIFFADITKIDLLNLLNQNRQDLGLNPLHENLALDQAAQLKAQDMVKNGYFAHQSPAGITPWFWFVQAGYVYKYAGENLAVGFVDSKTVYDAWFNSPGHKANLLNSHYTDVGTAVVGGFEGNSIIVVQEFGSPLVKPAATVKPVVTIPKPVQPTETAPVAVTPVQIQPAQTQAPAPEPVTPTPSASQTVSPEPQRTIPPQVLGQQTQYIVKPENATGKNDFYIMLANFMVYNSNTVLYYFSYILLAILAGYFFIYLILMSETSSRAFLLRPLLLIALLIISMLINRDLLAHFLPYQVTI